MRFWWSLSRTLHVILCLFNSMVWDPSQILMNGFNIFVLVLLGLKKFHNSYQWKFLEIIFPFNILWKPLRRGQDCLLLGFNDLLGCYWTRYGSLRDAVTDCSGRLSWTRHSDCCRTGSGKNSLRGISIIRIKFSKFGLRYAIIQIKIADFRKNLTLFIQINPADFWRLVWQSG